MYVGRKWNITFRLLYFLFCYTCQDEEKELSINKFEKKLEFLLIIRKTKKDFWLSSNTN